MIRGLKMLVCTLGCLWAFLGSWPSLAEEGVSTTVIEASDGSGYILGPDDVLDIQVWEEADLSGTFTVGETGLIDLPLVGEIEVMGRTASVVSEDLRQRLGRDFLVEPQVAVTVETHRSHPVLVQGAIRQPDRYFLSRPTTLLDILAEAGGILVERSSQEVHLMRDDDSDPVIIRLDPLMSSGEGNIQLRAGDIIYVPENEVVYVSGQVVSPGAVTWRDGLTIFQAVTEAGGASPGANMRRAYILRGGERIEVNLRRVIRGRDPDLPLRAEDQLFIDESVL